MLTFATVMETLKTEKGLALQDLLTGAHEYIDTLDLGPAARIYILDQIATIEYVVLHSLNPTLHPPDSHPAFSRQRILILADDDEQVSISLRRDGEDSALSSSWSFQDGCGD